VSDEEGCADTAALRTYSADLLPARVVGTLICSFRARTLHAP
jgi:hypothetical protein